VHAGDQRLQRRGDSRRKTDADQQRAEQGRRAHCRNPPLQRAQRRQRLVIGSLDERIKRLRHARVDGQNQRKKPFSAERHQRRLASGVRTEQRRPALLRRHEAVPHLLRPGGCKHALVRQKGYVETRRGFQARRECVVYRLPEQQEADHVGSEHRYCDELEQDAVDFRNGRGSLARFDRLVERRESPERATALR
jgi:hypothetical protein